MQFSSWTAIQHDLVNINNETSMDKYLSSQQNILPRAVNIENGLIKKAEVNIFATLIGDINYYWR